MKERPILFNTQMVNAILEGRKTQTRRIVKPQPEVCDDDRGGHWWPSKTVQSMVHVEKELQDYDGMWRGLIDDCNPFGGKGDHLWVRETFRLYDSDECPHADFPCGCPRNGTPLFKASHDCGDGEKWKPSIHMPRSVSRILLEITKIRLERLQDISESDCLKEGVGSPILRDCKKPKFMQLWESINGADSWAVNPWVWVVEFKIIQGGEA